MPSKLIKRLLFLGGIAIAGIIFIQSFWVIKTWNLQDDEFHLSATSALRAVAERIGTLYKTDLPKQNLITRRSTNYYAVNVNSEIDANVLEDYLIQEFEKRSLNTDFEYAVFDCDSDSLVYGNYCDLADDKIDGSSKEQLPRFNELIYYFVVKFPSRGSYLLSNMWQSVLFSIIALLAVMFFIYAIWIILKQKQLTEQQKDFINNMTHEFKTPISSIKIASDVLINNSAIKEDARMSNYAAIIKNQNERLNNQVEKVLNIARLENDQFQLKKEKINLEEELVSILSNEQMKFEKKGGYAKIDFPDKEIHVLADRLHFTNIISNILDNALKYSKTEPQAIISVKERSDEIKIEIKDKGIGITKENQKKLFSKFYRVPTGNVHNVKGFGLGLYYVRNISRAHGWRVELESEESKGTTVSISIPKTNV
jgi:two-component system phosphate regulon sensor histidine kinase PhoR